MDREDQKLWQELERVGVVQHSTHIILGSGLHTDTYANFVPAKVPLFERSQIVLGLQSITPHKFQPRELEVDWFIVGTGCGFWYAAMVANHFDAECAYAEKLPDGRLIFRREQAAKLKGKKIIILDDVLSTGSTVKQLGKLILQSGGDIEGVVFILDRNRTRRTSMTFSKGIRFQPQTLFHVPMRTWVKAACPMCAKGIPFSTEHGAGADEFHRHGQPIKKL